MSLIGENRVLKFDRENNLVGQVEMEVPGLVVGHPTRDLLIVGRSMSAVNPPASVALIRSSDMTLLGEIEVLFPAPTPTPPTNSRPTAPAWPRTGWG